MPFKAAERIRETSTTTGTGTYTLAGAPTGYQPCELDRREQLHAYFITDGTNWEVGIGQYLAGPDRLTRDFVLASSNAGAAVNWGAGTRTIRCGWPAWLALPRYLSKSVAGGAGTTVLTQNEQRARVLEFTGALTGNRVIEVDATPWDWIGLQQHERRLHAHVPRHRADRRRRAAGRARALLRRHRRAHDERRQRARIKVETATNKINMRTLDFDQATQQHAQFVVSMPKGWDIGTLTAKFIWLANAGTARKASSGASRRWRSRTARRSTRRSARRRR
jgi:hypothetical protein